VGACVADVAGEIGERCLRPDTDGSNTEEDTVEVLGDRSIDEVLDASKLKAVQEAITRGADPTTVRVVEADYFPVQVCIFSFVAVPW